MALISPQLLQNTCTQSQHRQDALVLWLAQCVLGGEVCRTAPSFVPVSRISVLWLHRLQPASKLVCCSLAICLDANTLIHTEGADLVGVLFFITFPPRNNVCTCMIVVCFCFFFFATLLAVTPIKMFIGGLKRCDCCGSLLRPHWKSRICDVSSTYGGFPLIVLSPFAKQAPNTCSSHSCLLIY